MIHWILLSQWCSPIVSYSDWWILADEFAWNMWAIGGTCGVQVIPLVDVDCTGWWFYLLVNFHITDRKTTLFNGTIYYNYGHLLQSKLWNCRRVVLLCSFHVASIMGFSDPLNCDLFHVFSGGLWRFFTWPWRCQELRRYRFHIYFGPIFKG